jgi:ribose/xylose/arabinose/galactoside ABC-type transport system permease subunit
VFALGSNEATVRLCGINVSRTRIAVYALGGLFAGIAGIYQFTALGQGDPMGGVGKELRIIAAVVVGGGSLSGGRGSVLGTLSGAAIMAVIDHGCTMLGIDDMYQDILIGAIIIAAVALDQYRQRRAANAA